ncbi:MAG TPA: hypothetical protein VMT30_00330 [Candidatus Saccharimonadia bacterium]|nr:hypothetical protein [Candidatus Saccharimonadia bacterium]
MIVYLLYNKRTSAERLMAEFNDRLQREQLETELLDADTPRGIQLAESYDIVGRPAVLILKTDGALVQVWQGEDSLPAPSDVAYLARQ